MVERRDLATGDGPAFPVRIGRYELLLPIASGGMATVYLARARGIEGFEREVALKLIHPHLQEEAEFSRGLLEEAKLAARIRHPNVVSVLDVGRDPAGVYMVMDYVEGSSLSGLLHVTRAVGARLPTGIGLKIVVDALAGLHAAHELTDKRGRPIGLVHRDVSPQNVLAGLDGIGRLTDFGVAKAATRLSRTNTGTVKGKLAYMAPEQARAERVDRRSDLWAAGVVIWELIAERRLFTGNEAAMILSIVSGDVPPLSSIVPDVPPAIDAAVRAALSLEPRRRPATALELRSALLAGASGAYQLADTAEVAAYVQEMIGAALDRRRERVESVLRSRTELGSVVRTEDLPTVRETPPTIEKPATRRSALIAMGGVVVGASLSVLAMRGAEREPQAKLEPPAAAVSAPAVSAPATKLEPIAAAEPAPVLEEPPSVRDVSVEASALVARVVIDGSERAIDPPAKSFVLEIPENARALSAVSQDGRTAALTLSPDRRRAKVRFASTRAPKPSAETDPLRGYNPYPKRSR